MQPPEDLPGLNKFLKEGVKAEYMKPLFPSLSYPSWTTLVTGLYPGYHGIVANYFYDPKDKDYFSLYHSTMSGKAKVSRLVMKDLT